MKNRRQYTAFPILFVSGCGVALVSELGDFDSFGPALSRGHTRYELTDHLGSVRAIVSDIKLNVSGSPAADLLSVADYDPYGASRSLRTLALSAEAPYRHAFQGMRLLEGAGGLAEYRTPFRLYDGRTGRWAGLDPVQQPWTSPYEGLGSLPVTLIDPRGTTEYYSNKGYRIGSDNIPNGITKVLTNSKDEKKVRRMLSSGSVDETTLLGSVWELPPMSVRMAIKESMERSNSPNSTDIEGGYHEEGGFAMKDGRGQFQSVHANPGPYTELKVNGQKSASVDVYDNTDGILPTPAQLYYDWHVHPRESKLITEGPHAGKVMRFLQSPSPADIAGLKSFVAANPALPLGFQSFVVGAFDNDVFVFTRESISDGKSHRFNLDKFFSIPDAPLISPILVPTNPGGIINPGGQNGTPSPNGTSAPPGQVPASNPPGSTPPSGGGVTTSMP